MDSKTLIRTHLDEAHAMETALVTNLAAHIALTTDPDYRALLERHLDETRRQVANIDRRRKAVGRSRRPNPIAAGLGLARDLAGQALVLTKGPIDGLRTANQRERMLKNAKDECATEALEIATYDAIEALATQLDEPEIAALAARHREEEVRMLADLRALIPTLAARPGKAETPQAGKTETPQPGNPIAGYDELNAGQIVARLSQLTQDQLAAVLAYERAHRNRRAVIEKGDELTATPPWTGYDEDSVEAILERLNGALAGAVRDYESRHRRRVEVLEAAQRELSGSA